MELADPVWTIAALAGLFVALCALGWVSARYFDVRDELRAAEKAEAERTTFIRRWGPGGR
jgi:hypothetical protein